MVEPSWEVSGEGAKPATLARELEVFRHSLNLAVREWEWLESNPFEKVKIEKPQNKKERSGRAQAQWV